jgi:hypothetical protein
MLTYRRAKSKPHRVSPRPPARFGAGLLPPSCPSHEAPAPLSDMAWHAATSAIFEDDAWDDETIMEQRAIESAALDSLERGFLPRDLAEMIASTRI